MAKAQQKEKLVINGPNDIPTFEELCNIKGWKAEDKLPNVSHLDEGMQRYHLAAAKREYIRQYINDGWEADWSDSSQRKYYIWPWIKKDENAPSGFALSCDCDYDDDGPDLGSRLYYRSSEIARYEFEKFKDSLWLDMILVQEKN